MGKRISNKRIAAQNKENSDERRNKRDDDARFNAADDEPVLEYLQYIGTHRVFSLISPRLAKYSSGER